MTECVDLREFHDAFNRWDLQGQLALMEQVLKEAGFVCKEFPVRYNRIIRHYVGGKYAFVVANMINSRDDFLYTFVDRDFYDVHLKGGSPIKFEEVVKKDGCYYLARYYIGFQNRSLVHQLVLNDRHIDLKDGEVIDHKFHQPLINIAEGLRPCNREQNNRNSKSYRGIKVGDGFDYNPATDFSNSWYLLVAQRMLGLWDDEEVFEFNERIASA